MPASVNYGVVRFAAAKDTLRYLERFYAADGELDVPTLTLHDAKSAVAAARRTSRRTPHAFTPHGAPYAASAVAPHAARLTRARSGQPRRRILSRT